MKTTGWFAPWQKPLKSRPGFYRTKFYGVGEGYSYWTGEQWGNQCRHGIPRDLALWREFLQGAEQNKAWQGVAR